jgi:transposase
MMEAGFLSDADRKYFRTYMNKRKADGLSVRRANALIALDKGRAPAEVCDVLEIGLSTLRGWLAGYEAHGASFLKMKNYTAREGHLSRDQEQALAGRLRDAPMRDTNEIRAHILKEYGQRYSASGCIKLLHRLGFVYKKPARLPVQADEQAQKDFIASYNALQNHLPEDEIIYFGDAVHPDHQVRPAHGWFHKDDTPVVPASSGRKRVNIHGALCLETFDCPFVEVQTVNANSTIALLERLEAVNKDKRVIHVILDNARYHHAALVREWLERPECKIKIIWLPPYAPHLNSIERLWGVMHKYVTHNKFYKTYNEFAQAILNFLRETVPEEWTKFQNTVTDNFRVISTEECKIIA